MSCVFSPKELEIELSFDCRGIYGIPMGPSLLSATKQLIAALTTRQWNKEWAGKADGLKRYVPRIDRRMTEYIHTELVKFISSVITQLRTKMALQDLLYTYEAEDSSACSYERGRQSMKHVLTACPRFIEDKRRTFGNARIDLRKILITKNRAVASAKLFIRIGLLKVFHGARGHAERISEPPRA